MTLGGGQMNNPGRYLTLLPPHQRSPLQQLARRTPRRTLATAPRCMMAPSPSTICHEPVHCFPGSKGLSLFRCSLLMVGPWRHHASGLCGRSSHQQWPTCAVCLRQRFSIRFRLWKPGSGLSWLAAPEVSRGHLPGPVRFGGRTCRANQTVTTFAIMVPVPVPKPSGGASRNESSVAPCMQDRQSSEAPVLLQSQCPCESG